MIVDDNDWWCQWLLMTMIDDDNNCWWLWLLKTLIVDDYDCWWQWLLMTVLLMTMIVDDSDCWWQWLLMTMTVDDNDCWWQWLLMTMTVDDSDCCWQWLLLTMIVDDNDCWWQWLLIHAEAAGCVLEVHKNATDFVKAVRSKEQGTHDSQDGEENNQVKKYQLFTTYHKAISFGKIAFMFVALQGQCATVCGPIKLILDVDLKF